MEAQYAKEIEEQAKEVAVVTAFDTPIHSDFTVGITINQNADSADEKIRAKADGRKHGDAQHHLFVPAHPLLRLTHCQGAHDRHGSPSLNTMKRVMPYL